MNRDAEFTTARQFPRNANEARACTDAELLAAMAQRQDWALAELYDRYSTVLYSLAMKILGEAMPAQDVLQEAFLTAWRKAELYNQKRGNVCTWLIVLCRNLAIDHYRAKMRLASRHVELEAAAEVLVAQADDPSNTALAVEDGRLLRQAMLQLLPEQKQVIEMAYFQGLSQSEIAEATGTPLGTVKTRTRQAMMKLRESLQRAGKSTA
ncbi:MAG: sigma-70 family RNA polymerase sigma factor [bacterium]